MRITVFLTTVEATHAHKLRKCLVFQGHKHTLETNDITNDTDSAQIADFDVLTRLCFESN